MQDLFGKYAIESLCNIPVFVDIASEFRYRNPLIDKNTLCIFISQSGETADTISSLRLAKKLEAKTIAITNVFGSSITRDTDFCIYTHAGPEIAVASTKAYTCQVVILNMIAIYFAEILGTSNLHTLNDLKQDILLLPEKINSIFEVIPIIQDISEEIYNEKYIFFLGRGIDYNIAMEASLKLKEISYIHSEAYASGELKHGPIALIEDNIYVINIMTDSNLLEKSMSNIQEVITRGAKTISITNLDFDNKFDYTIHIPPISTLLAPILAIIPLQLLSYYISKNKGLDVDKPRNLAKSVTVE